MSDSSRITVKAFIERLPHAPADLPAYQTPGSAGMDLILAGDSVTIDPWQRVLLPTGFRIALPEGFEAQIRLRSGFALRSTALIPNAPGTIDSDYRGEVKVMILNASTEPLYIEKGTRFAQMVVAPVASCEWTEISPLPESVRGAGGFGSTGHA
jgi:dUTP pyrophosphatase